MSNDVLYCLMLSADIKRVFKDVWRFMLTSNVVCWRLLVSNDVLYCLMLSADVERMSKKFLKGYLSAVYGFI